MNEKKHDTLCILMPTDQGNCSNNRGESSRLVLIPSSIDCVVSAQNPCSTDPPFVQWQDDSVIGKYNLLQAIWNACPNHRASNSKICHCPTCEDKRRWIQPSIPRRLLRFRSQCLWVRNASYATKNYVHLIRKWENLENPSTIVLNDPNRKEIDNSEAWMGPWNFQIGDILRFLVVREHAKPNTPPLEFQFGARIATLQNDATGMVMSSGSMGTPPFHTQPLESEPPPIKETIPPSVPLISSLPISESKIGEEFPLSSNHKSREDRVPIISSTDMAETIQTKDGPKFVLFFVEKGTDMHRVQHIATLRANAQRRGALVLDHFDKVRPPWPTHLVISTTVTSLESVATALGFDDLEEMSLFLQQRNIVCATRDWASRLEAVPYAVPTIMERIPGFRTKKRRLDDSAASATVHSQDRNRALSDLFRKLAKLHQECPLYANDDWKAYMFHLISGRLRQLDYEVELSVLDRVRRIPGFGASTMQIIEEFLQTGACSRVQEFEKDPLRVAMKVMMNIWGVGRVRATELVNAGHRRIGTVRQAVNEGILHLDRNQFIGLMCYEDIMDKMTRDEVESIAEVVKGAVRQRYPDAEIVIMGSYRRGKLECGDVDILITHPDHKDQVPPDALGQIVDDLRASGHVAYHLTFISGMKHELFESLPASLAKQLTNPKSYGRSKDKNDKYSMSSWMGIMNSPTYPGKHRRVDIKFYPYHERVFAALYFTGNGHFNRSMRLWSTRKFNYMLSDHGIVEKNSQVSVLSNPSSEKEVFDLLGLKWKETTERECFDDVEPVPGINDVVSHVSLELTRDEIARDSSEHSWIE
jgi:DNA polymerase/3'-5' exonuclease PolX